MSRRKACAAIRGAIAALALALRPETATAQACAGDPVQGRFSRASIATQAHRYGYANAAALATGTRWYIQGTAARSRDPELDAGATSAVVELGRSLEGQPSARRAVCVFARAGRTWGPSDFLGWDDDYGSDFIGGGVRVGGTVARRGDLALGLTADAARIAFRHWHSWYDGTSERASDSEATTFTEIGFGAPVSWRDRVTIAPRLSVPFGLHRVSPFGPLARANEELSLGVAASVLWGRR